jgi:hypothetical protein
MCFVILQGSKYFFQKKKVKMTVVRNISELVGPRMSLLSDAMPVSKVPFFSFGH